MTSIKSFYLMVLAGIVSLTFLSFAHAEETALESEKKSENMTWKVVVWETVDVVFATLGCMCVLYVFWWIVKDACKTAIKESKS